MDKQYGNEDQIRVHLRDVEPQMPVNTTNLSILWYHMAWPETRENHMNKATRRRADRLLPSIKLMEAKILICSVTEEHTAMQREWWKKKLIKSNEVEIKNQTYFR